MISDDDRDRNMVLTMGAVSCSGPGLLTEVIFLRIAGTVEIGKRIEVGSGCTSTGG